MERKDIHLIWLSDFDLNGSGYLNISVPICSGLTNLGYDVKAIGLGYAGTEHYHPFPIIPCKDLQEADAMLQNLKSFWGISVVIVALDIQPYQDVMCKILKRIGLPYVCITPLESDPLCLTWAMLLQQIDKVFIISEFGTQECKKVGVSAEHIVIGVDTKAWRTPIKDEKQKLRNAVGIADDDFVILTVADNQERKNLSKAFMIVSCLKYGLSEQELWKEMKGEYPFSKLKTRQKVQYILVTREHSRVGWKLRDMAFQFGINTDTRIIPRGIKFSELWGFYAMSDVFLLTSKAEGCGLPILESMSVGIPVVATKAGAIVEHLENKRGFCVDYDYVLVDPWGNSNRYMINVDKATEFLDYICNNDVSEITQNASNYVKQLTWEIPVSQIDKAIMEIADAQKEQTPPIPA